MKRALAEPGTAPEPAVVLVARAFVSIVERAIDRLDSDNLEIVRELLQRAHDAVGGELVRRAAQPESTS